MPTVGEAVVVIRADGTVFKSEVQKEVKKGLADSAKEANKLDKNLKKSTESAKALGGQARLLKAGLTAAVAGFGKKATEEFRQFDKGIREVFTLLPDLSESALAEISEQAREFSREFGVLTKESVPALYQAISAGVPSDNVFAFLEISQKAALGGVTSLETAVNGLTTATNAYGLEVLSATEASDSMFTAVRLGKLNFEQLSRFMFQVVPVASALGVSFDDVNAAITTLTTQGVPVRVAATQIRQALLELSTAGSEVDKTFQSLTGDTFTNFIANGGNLQEGLQLLGEHAEASGVLVKDLFSGIEAGNAALGLAGKNAETYANILDQFGDKAGATADAFEIMNESLDQQFKRLGAAIESAFIDGGTAMEDGVREMIEVLIDLADELATIATAFGGGLSSALKIAATLLEGLTPIIEAVAFVLDKIPVSILATVAAIRLMRSERVAGAFTRLGTSVSNVGANMTGFRNATLSANATLGRTGGIGTRAAAGVGRLGPVVGKLGAALPALAIGLAVLPIALEFFGKGSREAQERAETLTEELVNQEGTIPNTVARFEELVATLNAVEAAADGAGDSIDGVADESAGLASALKILADEGDTDTFNKLGLDLDEFLALAKTGTDIFDDLGVAFSHRSVSTFGGVLEDATDSERAFLEGVTEMAKEVGLTNSQLEALFETLDKVSDSFDDSAEEANERAETTLNEAVARGLLTQTSLDLALATAEAADEHNTHNAALIALSPRLENLAALSEASTEELYNMDSATRGLIQPVRDLEAEQEALALSEKEAAAQAAAEAQAIMDFESAVSSAKDEINDFANVIDTIFGDGLDLEQMRIDVNNAVNDFNEAFTPDDEGVVIPFTIDVNSQEGLDFRQDFIDTVGTLQEAIGTAIDQGDFGLADALGNELTTFTESARARLGTDLESLVDFNALSTAIGAEDLDIPELRLEVALDIEDPQILAQTLGELAIENPAIIVEIANNEEVLAALGPEGVAGLLAEIEANALQELDIDVTGVETGFEFVDGLVTDYITEDISNTANLDAEAATDAMDILLSRVDTFNNIGLRRTAVIDVVVNNANVNGVPALANGAVIDRPTLALVGEAGKEVVIPLTNPARAAELAKESGLLEVLEGRQVRTPNPEPGTTPTVRGGTVTNNTTTNNLGDIVIKGVDVDSAIRRADLLNLRRARRFRPR